MENKSERYVSLEINVLYMASLAMDLILRDAEWRMRLNREAFKREKKQVFTRFTKAVRDACIYQEMLTDDIFQVDSTHNYRNVQTWQDEANELARLVLLYADRSADQEVTDAIFKFIREQPCEGIADDKLMESFYLAKL